MAQPLTTLRSSVSTRLSVGEDGRTLNYEFVLEDPDYLLERVGGRAVWDYRPDLQPVAVECDLEAARRFLQPLNERER